MVQTIVPIGNSAGVIIPKSLRDDLGLVAGEEIVLEKDKLSGALIIRKKSARRTSSITPDFLEAVAKVTKRYDRAFRDLATK